MALEGAPLLLIHIVQGHGFSPTQSLKKGPVNKNQLRAFRHALLLLLLVRTQYMPRSSRIYASLRVSSDILPPKVLLPSASSSLFSQCVYGCVFVCCWYRSIFRINIKLHCLKLPAFATYTCIFGRRPNLAVSHACGGFVSKS